MPPNTLDRLYATVITLSEIQREKALNYIVPKPFLCWKNTWYAHRHLLPSLHALDSGTISSTN